jgi:hypothetical protein
LKPIAKEQQGYSVAKKEMALYSNCIKNSIQTLDSAL